MLADLDAEFERFEREQFRNFAHGSTLSVEEMKEMLDDVEADQE
jgi:hypothetical protein